MTEQRRVDTDSPKTNETAGSRVLTDLRATDAPIGEYVRTGGLLGLSVEEMFS